MKKELFDYILNKGHHAHRRRLDVDLASDFAARGKSPAERMSERFCLLLGEERPVILPGERIAYLRTVENLPAIFTDAEWEAIGREHHIHELGFLSNLTPDYATAIGKGLLALREGADEYGKRAIDGILALADRYREEAERVGRGDLAALLSRVPRYGARSFHEALQSFRILHFSLWLEGNYHVTVGRFDRYMYPYLAADLAAGVLTEEEAFSLLCEFFLSFNRDSDLYPGVQQGDNGQSMMLGGVDEEGRDSFNLLSELCLRASAENRLIDPKINLRVDKNTPPERFCLATELTKCGLGFPQYSNDDVVIPGLVALGYELADARNYGTAACWEFIIPEVGADIANIAALSYPKAVDTALHRDLMTAKSYDEFFAAVKREMQEEVDKICDSIRDVWFVPSPFMSLLFGRDISLGGKYNNFGMHGTGIATATDSLAAIKRYVFEEGTVSREEMIRAVDTDFSGMEELLHLLRYRAPKLGNNDPFADEIACDLLSAFADTLEGKRNCRGGIWRAGTGSAMYYLWHAAELGASPDGRRRGEPFGTNFSVSLFAKVKGPVSVIGSMTKQNFLRAINGGPLTLEFHSSVFASEDGVGKIASLVRQYIALGGHQLQLNTVSTETMLAAQKDPEAYRRLIVRIWGWSAYFTELSREYQDHVIARQAYTL